MHQGIDLSRFRKVSSDKKCVTLRHVNGHEMKIASSALTPKMREHIDSLPDHKETSVKRYADGTPDKPVSKDDQDETETQDPEAMDPASPAPAADTPAETPLAPENPQKDALAQIPQQTSPQAEQPAPAAQPSQAPQPPAAPEAGAADVMPPQKPTPQQVTQNLNNETAAFASDLSQGHIKPETYQDLYGKKDTLGKIGTLFGLLVSGAGAGLTHQPNAVLHMMDKEIERDMDAQKQSASNKASWYTKGLEHQMNQAHIEQMGIQNLNTLATAANTQAQTGKVPYEIAETQARTQGLSIDNQIKHQTVWRNNMELGILQDLQDQGNKLPDGPIKDQFQKTLNTVSQNATQRMQQRNQEAGQKIAAVNAMAPAAGAQPQETAGIDMDKLNTLNKKVALGEKLNVPVMVGGVKVDAKDLAKATDESEMVERNRALYNMWDKSFKKLSSMAVGGKLNPAMRDAEVELLASEILKQATGSGMGYEEAHKKANAMFPDWKDFLGGGARQAKRSSMRDQFMAREASAITAKRLGLIKPFPGDSSGKTAKGASGNWDKTTATGGKKYPEGTVMNGHVVQGGKWVPSSTSTQAKK